MEQTIQHYLAKVLEVEENALEPDIERIDDILRRRLTKKERKLLRFFLEGGDVQALKQKLGLDDARFDEINETMIKKLRHPKIRNDLVQGA